MEDIEASRLSKRVSNRISTTAKEILKDETNLIKLDASITESVIDDSVKSSIRHI